MKKVDLRLNRSVTIRLPLGLLVIPFLVGFDYPDSTGTYAKISGGGGSYRFSPGCSKYNYRAQFEETEIALQHRMAIKPTEAPTSFLSKLAPSHLSFAGTGGLISKQIKVIGYDSTTDDFGIRRGPGPGDLQIGWREDALGLGIGAKIGLDWRWLGAMAGISTHSYGKGEAEKGERDDPVWSDDLVVLPILGLRLGDANLVYLSGEFMNSSPIASGGGVLSYGVGGKLGATRLWGGYGGVPYKSEMAVLKVSRPVGPVSLSLGGEVGVESFSKLREYGFAVGVAYRLPWGP